MSMGGVVTGIVAAEEPDIRAACLWSPAAVAPFEVGAGFLKGRDIAVELKEKGYFDADSHRMSPALVDDIARLDVYGRSRPYTGPVRIIHGDRDDIAPLSYARRYLDHYTGNAEPEVVEGRRPRLVHRAPPYSASPSHLAVPACTPGALPMMIDELVAKLDLETKTRLLAGQDTWSLPALPEIGLAPLVVSDGPIGVRGTERRGVSTFSSLPPSTCTAARWAAVTSSSSPKIRRS
ncbi:hypothetical protein ABZ897_43675 [Nonomuraea sp. NPDC046802]|uniref:hypothetical protein n=1 Tax=Nonomuraea sp. NPDC046802 TaxID=3154919 RepID=UPI0033EB1F23